MLELAVNGIGVFVNNFFHSLNWNGGPYSANPPGVGSTDGLWTVSQTMTPASQTPIGAGTTQTVENTMTVGSPGGLSGVPNVVQLAGGTLIDTSGIVVSEASRSEIAGTGVVASAIVNGGTVAATGGVLATTGSVSGSGVLQNGANATLRLDGIGRAAQSREMLGSDPTMPGRYHRSSHQSSRRLGSNHLSTIGTRRMTPAPVVPGKCLRSAIDSCSPTLLSVGNRAVAAEVGPARFCSVRVALEGCR